jgi:hypothetical protein
MIDMPARIARLPRDRRGLPIPVTVFRDSEGQPHFAINEEAVRQRVIRRDECPICGEKLLRYRWFVGGPRSAFDEHGAYIDPPMHDECAHYALRVCPYLAAPNYNKRVDTRTLKTPSTRIFIDNNMIPGRPSVFVAVRTVGQRKFWGHDINGVRMVRFLKPVKPYRIVEYWNHGTMAAPP